MASLPPYGYGPTDKEFVYETDGTQLCAKVNLPEVGVMWFLPGNAVFRGGLSSSEGQLMLEGCVEASHQNLLTRLFLLSVVAIFGAFAVVEVLSDGGQVRDVFGVLGFTACIALLTPLVAWWHLWIWQREVITNLLGWLAHPKS